MLSLVLDGKVLDYRYKKRDEFTSSFYVGDILVGQVFDMGRSGWSAVCCGDCVMRPAEGFKTRYAASKFMLQSKGLEKH